MTRPKAKPLKRAAVRPFKSHVEISGNSSSAALAMSIKVAQKQQASTREQGEQALQLIQSASQPAQSPGGVGSQLNVTA